MPKTIGKFDYEITKMDKDADLPFDPYLRLCLKTYGNTSRDGSPLISANLMTDHEIMEYIAQLKDDLDAVAKSAKAALARAKAQTLQQVSGRLSK